MKIVIPGGTGQLGTMLARQYHTYGHEIVVLGRSARNVPWKTVLWDPVRIGPWADEFEAADAVINLAGRSVNCRYTPANQHEILYSRLQSVRAVSRAISRADTPPPVWIQASTATIYPHRYDAACDETTEVGDLGKGAPESWRFSMEVAKTWENAFDDAPNPYTRKVKLRSAVVMSPDKGGIFDTLLGLVRRGLGGTAGNGRQYVSWIHGEDFARSVMWLIQQEHINGVVNIAAPNPLPNREFMASLRKTHGVRIGIPAPKIMLELGAAMMGTETELLLKSRRVVPKRLLKEGFEFRHPNWSDAAADLCRRWKER